MLRRYTVENRSKIGALQTGGSSSTNFAQKGTSPPIIFARIVNRPMNALQLCRITVFTQRNFVADFLRAKCDFTPKTAVLCF